MALALLQHLFQRSILSERLWPADIFFEFRASFHQILNHILDSLVGDERGALEQSSIRLDSLLDNRRVLFAHPF